MNKANRYLITILFALVMPVTALGQSLTDYLEDRISVNVKARIAQTDPTKQSEPPAQTGNSTSLVERSSAPDLLGLGLDFLNLSDASGEKKTATPKTVTFSAYALKSFLSSEDPLDPEIYNRNQKWRAVSFTLGYDVPENSDDRDPVAGIKWRIYDGRDVSSSANTADINTVETALANSGVAFSQMAVEVLNYMFTQLQLRNALPPTATTLDAFEGAAADSTQFPAVLAALTDEEKKQIDAIVSNKLSAFVNLTTVTKQAVKNIRSRPQLALSFLTTQRRGDRPDEYSGALTFDKGMGQNSMTVNGSFFYKNKRTGQDARGGKFAAALHVPLRAFKPLDYKDPLRLTLEADATAATGETPMYRGQAKLTIPFLPGMEIPISVSVANRSEFVKEKEVRGKFGFTFDVSKLMKAFRDNFERRL